MIYIIEPTLRSQITDLPFIERYGGIAIPYKTTLDGGSKGMYPVSFPVSANLTENDCLIGGKLANLVPDDNYKSLAYFEGVSTPANVLHTGVKQSILEIKTGLKLVVWVNLPKVGIGTTPESIGILALETAKALYGTKGYYDFNYSGTSGHIIIGNYRISFDSTQVFSGYTYQDKQAFLMYPYGYFTILLDVTIKVGSMCNLNSILTPINCITEW